MNSGKQTSSPIGSPTKRKPFGPVKNLVDARVALYEVYSIAVGGQTASDDPELCKQIADLMEGIIEVTTGKSLNELKEKV